MNRRPTGVGWPDSAPSGWWTDPRLAFAEGAAASRLALQLELEAWAAPLESMTTVIRDLDRKRARDAFDNESRARRGLPTKGSSHARTA